MRAMTHAWPRPGTVELGWTEVRGSGGRLLCRIDACRLLLEVKPKGGAAELIDLRPLLRAQWLEVCKSCIDPEETIVVE